MKAIMLRYPLCRLLMLNWSSFFLVHDYGLESSIKHADELISANHWIWSERWTIWFRDCLESEISCLIWLLSDFQFLQLRELDPHHVVFGKHWCPRVRVIGLGVIHGFAIEVQLRWSCLIHSLHFYQGLVTELARKAYYFLDFTMNEKHWMQHLGIDRQLCIGYGDQEDPVLGLAI